MNANCTRNTKVGSLVQSCGMIVGIKEINAKPGYPERPRFAASGRTGDDENLGPHLSAEVALRTLLHVFWQVSADTSTLMIGNTDPLQLFGCRLDALAGRMQMGINFRFPQLRCINRRHCILIILRLTVVALKRAKPLVIRPAALI